MSSQTVDAPFFRLTCSKFATGVAIAAVIGRDGAPHGMTVNSFTSVSLDPPLVLVCIDRKAAILEDLLAAETMSINILSENQRELSSRFARKGEERFGAIEWYAGETGVPLLPGTLGEFECGIRERIPAGDHIIFIAEALAGSWREGRPLLYFDSAYQFLN